MKLLTVHIVNKKQHGYAKSTVWRLTAMIFMLGWCIKYDRYRVQCIYSQYVLIDMANVVSTGRYRRITMIDIKAILIATVCYLIMIVITIALNFM